MLTSQLLWPVWTLLINNVWRRRRFFNKYKKRRTRIYQQLCTLEASNSHILCLMPHCKFKKKITDFSPLSLSLLQLLILCASGVLWLMRSLGCKSYISFPHSYQRSEFLKCRGQSPNMLEPPLTLLKWFFSPKKIAISTSRCWDGLYRLHISRYWKEKLLLYYPK